MLVAVVARPPVFGGKVKSFDADKAKAVPGVRHVVEIDRGVAVVADGFWPATNGPRGACRSSGTKGRWPDSTAGSSAKQYAELAKQPGAVAGRKAT